MEGYVRFSSSSPPANPTNGSNNRRFSFQESPSLDSSDSANLDSPQQQMVGGHNSGIWGRSMWGSSWSWPPPLQQFVQRWRTPSPQTAYQSNYMTLVPLSDDRLKPRRTKLIVGSVCVLALLAITGVFLLVPRGINVGTIEVHSTKMTFNSTTKTYRIILQADVPIYNPNYLKASVTGNLTVSFYDAEAGWGALGPVELLARTNPQVLSVNVDASNLPRRYTRVVYDQCFAFPRILVFFLLGTFQTHYLGYTATLPSADTYFLLDCSGAQDLGAAYSSIDGGSSSSGGGSSDSSLYSSYRKSLTGLPAEVQRLLQRRQKQQQEEQRQEQQPGLLFEQSPPEPGEQQQQQQVQHMQRVAATLPAQQQLQQHRRLHQQR